MFCNYCGGNIPDGAKFCNYCGAQLVAGATNQVEPQPTNQMMPKYDKPVVSQQNQVQPTYEKPLSGFAVTSFWLSIISFVLALISTLIIAMGGNNITMCVLIGRSLAGVAIFTSIFANRKKKRGKGYANWGFALGLLDQMFWLILMAWADGAF